MGDDRDSVLQRLYRTQLKLLGTIVTAAGVILMFVARIPAVKQLPVLEFIPFNEFGSTLLTLGLIGVGWDYVRARDLEQRTDERLDQSHKRNNPAAANAVVAALTANPDTMRTLLAPDAIRALIESGITVESGDDAPLALDTYRQMRRMFTEASERRYNTRVAITLSPFRDGPARGAGAMFVVTQQWEYSARVLELARFYSVPTYADYHASQADLHAAQVWMFEDTDTLNAASPEVFELVGFTVDGHPARITHDTGDDQQSYTATPAMSVTGTDTAGGLVRIAYTFRALVPAAGHLLTLDFDKPSSNIEVTLTHAATDIHRVNLTPHLGSTGGRMVRSEPDTAAMIAIRHDGLIAPGAGLAYTWTLASEL
ncbi:hypothetical protein [Amycolatopsis sp. NPDC004378]